MTHRPVLGRLFIGVFLGIVTVIVLQQSASLPASPGKLTAQVGGQDCKEKGPDWFLLDLSQVADVHLQLCLQALNCQEVFDIPDGDARLDVDGYCCPLLQVREYNDIKNAADAATKKELALAFYFKWKSRRTLCTEAEGEIPCTGTEEVPNPKDCNCTTEDLFKSDADAPADQPGVTTFKKEFCEGSPAWAKCGACQVTYSDYFPESSSSSPSSSSSVTSSSSSAPMVLLIAQPESSSLSSFSSSSSAKPWGAVGYTVEEKKGGCCNDCPNAGKPTLCQVGQQWYPVDTPNQCQAACG